MRIRRIAITIIAAYLASACSSANDHIADPASDHIKDTAQSAIKVANKPEQPAVTIDRASPNHHSKPESRAQLLDGIDIRYFNTISSNPIGFNTNLDRLGFPSENDWISAQNKTDEELHSEARNGSSKAKQLYIDRVISSIPTTGWHGTGNDLKDLRLGNQILEAKSMAMQNITDTGSVFSIYQAAALYNASSVGGNSPMIAASLQLAGELGDNRAPQALRTLISSHPEIEEQGISAGYSILKGYLPKQDSRK